MNGRLALLFIVLINENCIQPCLFYWEFCLFILIKVTLIYFAKLLIQQDMLRCRQTNEIPYLKKKLALTISYSF